MEQRSEARVPHNVRFFVHVHRCPDDPEMVGVALECEAVDFSPHGMHFRADTPLPSKSVVNITVGVGDPFAMFLLRGEIRWSRPMDEHHAFGVLLKDAEGTDYKSWETRFPEMFSAWAG